MKGTGKPSGHCNNGLRMVEKIGLKELSSGLLWRDFGLGFYQLLEMRNPKMCPSHYLLHGLDSAHILLGYIPLRIGSGFVFVF